MNRLALLSTVCVATLLSGCYSDSSKKQRAKEYAPYTGAVADQTITKARIEHFEKMGDTTAARLEREILNHQELKARSAHGVAQNPGLVVPQAVLGTSGDVQEKVRELESPR